MRRLRPWPVLLLLLLVLTSVSIAAQQTTGEIIGKITDDSGGVLPGVTVTIRGEGVPGAPTLTSTDAGGYRFPLLPPGTYELEFSLQGFSTLKRAAIPVRVGQSVEINVQMAVGALAEMITVEGAAPVVNTAAAEVATTYNREWVENAPTKRFSYFDLVNSSPGVSGTSNVGQSSGAQSMGSATNENQYQIDGTSISSTPWVSGDAVEEVEVLQLGASAQYGNVQGAVFNIVTRQGGNTFHGDTSYYYQSNWLTSRNTTPEVDGGRPYNRDTFRDISLQAGGPFIRDRLWFFGAYQDQRDYDSQPGVNPLFPAKNDARRVFWKFNWNITENHRILHGYHDDYYWIPDVPSAFTAPTTLGLSHGDNPTPNFVYTGVLSNTTLFEARYSGFWLNSSNDPNLEGTPRVMTRVTDEATGMITGGIDNWTENRSFRNSFSGKLSRYVDGMLGGSHDLAVGLQYGIHGSDQLNGPNDKIITNNGRPISGTTQLPYHQGAQVNWTGAYVEDTFRFGRLALNLGLRYDYSNASFPAFPLLDAQGNPTGEMSAANDSVYNWSTFSPRFGINYRLTEGGSSVVKAHYGRYYKELEQGEFRVAVPSITPAYEFTFDASGNRTNFVQTSSNANLRIDADMKAPYTDQYMIQFEQELMRNVGFQASFAHKRGEDYTAWQDTTGQYVQVPYVDSVGADATGDTIMVYRLVSSPAARIFLQTNPDGMYTRYRGATFQLTKRMSSNWQAVGSLVLSKAEGRLGSSARANANTTASSTAGTFGREAAGPNDFVNTDGLLIGDRPVVAKLQIVYRLPWGVMVSANMQHQTGRAYARQVRVSGLGFPAAPQINVETLDGSRRVADTNLIDLRAQKEFDFSPMRVAVFLDALNMTNSDSYESVGSVLGTSTAFGVGTRYIPPRRLQLGFKFRW
jgi:Carboxypeptidase regulatory-like domain/TonB-dependent Receptor Plug Domain